MEISVVQVLVRYNNRHVNENEIDWLLKKLPTMLAPMFDDPHDPEARVFETDVGLHVEDGHPSDSHAHVEIRIKAHQSEARKQRAGHIVYALRHGIRLLAHSEGHAPSIHVLDERRLLMGLEFIESGLAA
jgi:hypothetical protein